MLRSLFLLLIVFLGGCAQGVGELKPPDIRYGEDVCAECNMIISDPRYASGYAYEISPGRYESVLFDDIGDMLMHADKHPEHKIVAWYVHDFGSQEWLDATKASFVHSATLQTPMASGVAAHASTDAAMKQAQEMNGEVLDWDSLLARHRAGELGGAGHGGMMQNMN